MNVNDKIQALRQEIQASSQHLQAPEERTLSHSTGMASYYVVGTSHVASASSSSTPLWDGIECQLIVLTYDLNSLNLLNPFKDILSFQNFLIKSRHILLWLLNVNKISSLFIISTLNRNACPQKCCHLEIHPYCCMPP